MWVRSVLQGWDDAKHVFKEVLQPVLQLKAGARAAGAS